MAYLLDEIKKDRLTRKTILLPLNKKDKRKGGLVYLMTPNQDCSFDVMLHPLINPKFYESYYMERQPMYYISADKSKVTGAEVVQEVTIDDKFTSNGITFEGLDIDIRYLSTLITQDTIHSFERLYEYKVDKLTIRITGKAEEQEAIIGKLVVLNNRVFDKTIYGDYETYIRFMLHLYFGNAFTDKASDEMKIASALILSGAYNNISRVHRDMLDPEIAKECRLCYYYINDTNGEKKTKPKAYIMKVLKKGVHGKDVMKVADNAYRRIKNSGSIFKNYFSCKMFTGRTSLVEQETYSDRHNPITESGIMFDSGMYMTMLEADDAYDAVIRRSIYPERIRNVKGLQAIYDDVKSRPLHIKYTYLKLDLYKNRNLFYDLGYYNAAFFKHSDFTRIRENKIFADFMERLLVDKRFNSYEKQTVIIPVDKWKKSSGQKVWMYQEGTNPMSVIYKLLLENKLDYLKKMYGDKDFLFIGAKSYFVTNFSEIKDVKGYPSLFMRLCRQVANGEVPRDDERENEDSPTVIAAQIIDRIEKTQRLSITKLSTGAVVTPATTITRVPDFKQGATAKETIDNSKDLTKATNSKDINKDELKDELVDRVNKASSNAADVDQAMDNMDEDERIKEILAILAAEPDEGPNISAARTSRMLKLQDDFMDSEYKGKKVSEILSDDSVAANEKIEPIALPVDSVNPEWQNMRYMNVGKVYNIDRDILAMFNFFSDRKHPLHIVSIDSENTSTSEDAIETYTVVYENEFGKRFKIVIDVPILIDDKYMILRGNRKNIGAQLYPMPIMKTDGDEVQLASTYNKMFIRRANSNTGKSNVSADRFFKTLNKFKSKDLIITEGDNSRVCNRYECPIDYIDIGTSISSIETPHYMFVFNQDKLYKEFNNKIDIKNGFPVGYDKKTKEILYYVNTGKDTFLFFSSYLITMIETDVPGFKEAYDNTSVSVRYSYSEASVLGTKIPVIIMLAFYEGLETALKKANVEYQLVSKLEGQYKNKDIYDSIRFSDGYIVYRMNYASSLLMNGLKTVSTSTISLTEINSKYTYVAMLDYFGGRIKADGLNNFHELFVDRPITYEALQYYKLPLEFCDILVYANQLLTDNKFIKHTNLTASRRIRHNELIADMLYREVLSKSYGAYQTEINHKGGENATFSCKRNALINAVLLNSTTEDQSIINALREFEGYNKITAKGPGGLNQDRAYTLDKRAYDDSMLGVMSATSSFANHVGMDRQVTIDANVDGYRGYINANNDKTMTEYNPTQTFAMTESLTPYGITRDDPFRSAMNYGQTANHGVRVKNSTPLLITTGADEALPYMISNTFAHKTPSDGTVIEITDDHMIIEHKDPKVKDKNGNANVTYEWIDLRTKTEKNSSSGYFVTLKLDTDLKVGSKVKAGDIVAYDKSSFSDGVGHNSNIAYNIGTLAKVAIMYTDEGFEDSAIISESLSEAMATDIVLKKEIVLSKNTNVYNMCKVGDEVSEGDILLTIQAAYEDDDVNDLLKNLVGDEGDITELGRRSIHSKVTGVIQDIAIYRTCEVEEMSDSLKKIFKAYEKKINSERKVMESYGCMSQAAMTFPTTDKLEQTGKLKNCEDGVLIEIYMKYEDVMSVGDKMTYYSALKGVVKGIFDKGKEPRSSFRPNEEIHTLLSTDGMIARMTTAVILQASINKFLIEMSRYVKDKLEIPYSEDILNHDKK